MSLLDRLVDRFVRRALASSAPLYGEVAWADPDQRYAALGGRTQAYNPGQLVQKGGFRLIDQMRRDDQIKAALALKKLAVIAPGWRVVSPEEVKQGDEWKVRRFVESELSQLDGTLDNSITEVLSALDYGFSVSELVYEQRADGPWAGNVGLRAIKTRKPHHMTFETDEFGNLLPDGITQDQGTGPKRLPVSKFIVFKHQGEFGNPYGISDLEAAYRAWQKKDQAYTWLAMFMERFGIPPVFLLYDPGSLREDQLTALKNVFSRMQTATSAMIPRKNKDSAEIWSPELAGQVSTVFLPALEMYNTDMARALLMPQLLGISADVAEGSFARAKVHFDVFLLVVNKLRSDVAEFAINEQVVRRLVDLNFGGGPYPIFQFNPLTEELVGEMLQSWGQMVGSEVVTPQPDDEDHVRKLMGFPPRAEPEEGEEGDAETSPIKVQQLEAFHIQAGLVTKNEARAMMGLPPLAEGGDEMAAPPPPPVPPSGTKPGEEKPAPGEDDDDEEVETAAKKKLAEVASTAKTLYVRRDVINVTELHAWARAQGFEKLMNPGQVHVTIAYSKQPVLWGSIEPQTYETQVWGEEWTTDQESWTPTPRSVARLGDEGAIVLFIDAPELARRWQELKDHGATWDYPEYRPHVTITYEPDDVDLSKVEPFRGTIVLGPEVWEVVDKGTAHFAYNPDQERDESGKWTSGGGGSSGAAPANVLEQVRGGKLLANAGHMGNDARRAFYTGRGVEPEVYDRVQTALDRHGGNADAQAEADADLQRWAQDPTAPEHQMVVMMAEYEESVVKAFFESQDARRDQVFEDQFMWHWNQGYSERYKEQGYETPREAFDATNEQYTDKDLTIYRKGSLDKDVQAWTTSSRGANTGATYLTPDHKATLTELRAQGFRPIAGISRMVGAPGEAEVLLVKFPVEKKAHAESTPLSPGLSRQPNRYEHRCNFAQVRSDLDVVSTSGTGRVQEALRAVKDAFIKMAKRPGEWTLADVRELKLTKLGDVEEAIASVLRDAMRSGAERLRSELDVLSLDQPAVVKEFATVPNVKPTAAMRYLKTKAFYITGVISDKVLADARAVLLAGIEAGELLGETAGKLEAVFDPYVGDETVIRDGEVVSPFRLETIIRTNVTDAYNRGRVVEGRALGQLVSGFEYSAILDDRTTEICRELDGSVFAADDPNLDRIKPPNHFNCRSVLVPITVDTPVDEDDFASAELVGRVRDMMGAGFGGT